MSTARLRRTALITGASSGIGKAFAEVLASEGYDLVLTARRAERLDSVARMVTDRYHVATQVMVEDLTDVHAPERLIETIVARGSSIDVLINNAGYGVPGTYTQTTWRQQSDFLQVMV